MKTWTITLELHDSGPKFFHRDMIEIFAQWIANEDSYASQISLRVAEVKEGPSDEPISNDERLHL